MRSYMGRQVINFNYYTDAISFQRILEGQLEKKAGRNFGPPGTKTLIYFVDDVNLPQLDQYNTQTPIAQMRTHIDHSSWYETRNTFFVRTTCGAAPPFLFAQKIVHGRGTGTTESSCS